MHSISGVVDRRGDCTTCGPNVKVKPNRAGWRCALSARSTPTKEQRRRDNLWQKYRMTVEDFDQLVIAQGGRCALCSKATADLVIDHCHTTSSVRGLLCQPCNVGLGWYEVLRPYPVEAYLARTNLA